MTVIVLYLDDQTSENVNFVLGKFLGSVDFNVIANKLVILYQDRVRMASS